MISQKDINETYEKIRSYIIETPLIYAEELSKISGAKVYLKMEQMQVTGSFKIRGMLSKVLSIKTRDFNRPFVAASTGNHAAAFGYASEKFGFDGTLFLPLTISVAKMKALKKYRIKKEIFGMNSSLAEKKATEFAKESNAILIHPYNDIEVIKGQGTLAKEIQKQLPEVDCVLVPVGGGGLVSGISLYFKEEQVSVIGCQPKNAAEMYESVKANTIVEPSSLKTISDASAGGIEEGAITFDICKKYVEDYEIIEEERIKEALTYFIQQYDTIIEPTSALPVAAIMNSKKYQGKNVVLVLTGSKINDALLTEIINKK